MNQLMERLKAERTPLVPQCMKNDIEEEGKVTFCSRADGNFCGAYAWPEKKWRSFDCPLADEFLRTKTEEQIQKTKINPIKASKRARK